MDVVTFRFEQLSDECKRELRREAIRLFPKYDTIDRIETLFKTQYRSVDIRRVYNTAPSQSYIIADRIITMPKDKYVEFCLRWL